MMPAPGRRTYEINSSCTSCGACIKVCPTESIFFGRAQYLIDSDTCDGSAVCAKVCPVNAIHPKPLAKAGNKISGAGGGT